MHSEFKNDFLWCIATDAILSFDDAMSFATVPEAGAVVLFSGNVRNHSDDREGVQSLEYEAYESQLIRSFIEIGESAKLRYDGICRIAIFHRLGVCNLSESTVIVVTSSEHRASGFEAARFCIDTLKHSSPIWKKENWEDGSDWALGANEILRVEEL